VLYAKFQLAGKSYMLLKQRRIVTSGALGQKINTTPSCYKSEQKNPRALASTAQNFCMSFYMRPPRPWDFAVMMAFWLWGNLSHLVFLLDGSAWQCNLDYGDFLPHMNRPKELFPVFVEDQNLRFQIKTIGYFSPF